MAPRIGQFEQLRLLTEPDLAQALLDATEDQWFDRTSTRTTAQHLADVMIGFANAEGGLIAVGLHGGRVEGVIGATAGNVNAWRQAALDFSEPPVSHRFESLPCRNRDGEPDEVILIEVGASERMHMNARGEVFLRVGDETRKLGALESQELRYDKGDSVFDGTAVPGARLQDLDDDQVERFARSVLAASLPIEELLEARGLLRQEADGPRPTVAGCLVLAKTPQREFPQAILRLLRYRGSSRETGVRSNVVDDVRIEGPLSEQIDQALMALRGWMPKAIQLGAEGRFGAREIIPEAAWLEAVVNALVHRSYSMAGDHVRVELFDDRLAVESPGRLPGLVRVENIRSTRFARNPRIARAMNDLGYGRELGEGVDRMFEEMERVGLPDPIYRQGPASVKVILLADPLSKRMLERLPRGSEAFVEHMSRMGQATTTEAVNLLGVSRPTALKYLDDLAEAGFLTHIGTSRKDPRGYWRTVQPGD